MDSVCKQSETEIANVIIVVMRMMIIISIKIKIMKNMMTMMMVVMMMMMMMMIKGKWASVNRGCGDRNSKHELRPHSVIHMCTPSSSTPSSPISSPPLGFTFLLSSSVSYLLFITKSPQFFFIIFEACHIKLRPPKSIRNYKRKSSAK